MSAERRLVVGATLGILLAAAGIVGSGRRSDLPPDAVAVVDGRLIPRAEYARRLGALAADRRQPLDRTERRRVLERMIDEDLLLARALELDLPRRDPRARKDLVSAMVDAAVASAAGEQPTEAELERFFAEHRGYFTPADRFLVDGLWFADGAGKPPPLERAAEAARALAGAEDIATVRARLADPEPLPVPAGALSLAELTAIFGPTAARAVTTLAPGRASAPIRVSAGARVVVLSARESPPAPTLSAMRDEVLREWQRRRGEAALQRAITELRGRARIAVAAEDP